LMSPNKSAGGDQRSYHFLADGSAFTSCVRKGHPADAPVITLGLTSETLPLTQLEDLADTRLAQKLSQVTGVGLVTLSGGQRPSVQVQVNGRMLASQGLSLASIQAAVVAGNVNTPKEVLMARNAR